MDAPNGCPFRRVRPYDVTPLYVFVRLEMIGYLSLFQIIKRHYPVTPMILARLECSGTNVRE